MSIKRLVRSLQKPLRQRKTYFREAQWEIAQKNLRMLKIFSLSVVGLLLLFLLVTPLILQGWTPSISHLLLLPVALVLSLLTLFFQAQQQKKRLSCSVVTFLCVLSQLILFACFIAIDVSPPYEAPSCFFPLICIILPALFIFSTSLTVGILFAAELSYLSAIFLLKPAFIRQYDVFISVVALMCAFTLSQVMMSLRVQDHELRMKYKQLSTQDALVGILNKKTCEEAVHRYLQVNEPSVVCTLLMLDIDDFKSVNDHLGHYTGDALLRAIGDLLSETFRATDIIGRIGGDEFLILVKNSSDQAILEEKCRTLQQKLARFSRDSYPMSVTCSIGGALVCNQPADFDTLFRQVDASLYEAKAAGKNRFLLRPYLT